MATIARVVATIESRPPGNTNLHLSIYPHEGLHHEVYYELPDDDFRTRFDMVTEIVIKQLKESFLHGRGMKDRNEAVPFRG